MYVISSLHALYLQSIKSNFPLQVNFFVNHLPAQNKNLTFCYYVFVFHSKFEISYFEKKIKNNSWDKIFFL